MKQCLFCFDNENNAKDFLTSYIKGWINTFCRDIYRYNSGFQTGRIEAAESQLALVLYCHDLKQFLSYLKKNSLI